MVSVPELRARWVHWTLTETPLRRGALLLMAVVAVGLLALGHFTGPGGWPAGRGSDHGSSAAEARPSTEGMVAAPLDARWLALPLHTEAAADVERLTRTADALRLPLERAQIRRTDAPAPLWVDEVELEIEAAYPAIRRYLARSLNEMPHAALRRLRLDRTGPESVRAVLTLRLHYRTEVRP